MQYPFIVLDTETTGVSTSDDRIVEIGIVKAIGPNEFEEKSAYINPEIPIPKSASDIHGITDEKVKDFPTFKQLSKGIMEFIKGCDILTFNGNQFDLPLLYAEFWRAGIEWDYSDVAFIDASVIFKRNEERTLSAAMKFYLGKDHEDAHGAIADAKATLEVFIAQQQKYELPKSVSEIALMSNYDKPRCDISGNFTVNDEGQYVLNFGKNKGKLASSEKGYLNWMLGANFMPDTVKIIRKILGK